MKIRMIMLFLASIMFSSMVFADGAAGEGQQAGSEQSAAASGAESDCGN